MQYHPYANLFPMMPDAELAYIVEDMKANGYDPSMPVITYEGQILDGRNRFKAADMAGVEPSFVEYQGDDALAYVIRHNLHRRHLDVGQKAAIVDEIAILKRGRNWNNSAIMQNKITVEQAANQIGVSARTVHEYREVKREAPELAEKVKHGEIKLSEAKKEIKKQKKEAQVELAKATDAIQNKEVEIDIQPGWYKVGNQFLFYGDNTSEEFISKLPQSSFAFADPPYNAGVDDWDSDYVWQLDYLQDKADIVAVTPGGWNAFNFYKESNMNYIWEMFCWINNGMTHGRCGFANVIKTSIFGNKKPKISQDFWQISIKLNEGNDTKHKGRKPYEFMIHLLNMFSKEGDTIIDPFGGSGTTLVLCEQMNRVSYNAEINKEYCIDIIKRIGHHERL